MIVDSIEYLKNFVGKSEHVATYVSKVEGECADCKRKMKNEWYHSCKLTPSKVYNFDDGSYAVEYLDSYSLVYDSICSECYSKVASILKTYMEKESFYPYYAYYE